MNDVFGQHAYRVRFDWGPAGAAATVADVAVVVDVLSFSTSVTVAVERGMRVYPFRWRDARAVEYAASRDAVLAVGRLEATRQGGPPVPSLSPSGLMEGTAVPRLVLPSPNGSTIAAGLADRGATVACGCLRNADAVARWLAPAVDAGRTVTVIAAGERWAPDDSLRPALEDHLGAGAILAALVARRGPGGLSPEAAHAADAFDASRGTVGARVRDCVGGRELAAAGFAADVEVAGALNASPTVPVLVDEAFSAADRG